MSGNRGFTLIEILTVLGILGLVIGTALFVKISTGRVEKDTGAEQAFFERRAMLMNRLKRDLRSSIAVEGGPPGPYRVKIIVAGADGLPMIEEVEYALSPDGKRVQRTAGRKVDTYDFSEFLGPRRFVFRLGVGE